MYTAFGNELSLSYQHAIRLYLRFTLSYRDVKSFWPRGAHLSYETVRRWVPKFGPAIARELRRSRPAPDSRWHLDEMVVRIAGKCMYLWQAVDMRVRSSTCWSSAAARGAALRPGGAINVMMPAGTK